MFQERRAVPLVLGSFALAIAIAVAAELPKPTGPVSDFAGVLGDAAERELTELLRAVERGTTAELAVVTVTSLEGLSIEEYATRLFNAWGVGQAGKDNGVLVVVDPSSRSVRIEVGYGLEGILPDGLAGAIIRRDFEPAFEAGNFNEGILSGVRRLADVVRKQHTLSAEERQDLAVAERQAELAAREPPAWVLDAIAAALVALGTFIAGLGLRTRSSSVPRQPRMQPARARSSDLHVGTGQPSPLASPDDPGVRRVEERPTSRGATASAVCRARAARAERHGSGTGSRLRSHASRQ